MAAASSTPTSTDPCRSQASRDETRQHHPHRERPDDRSVSPFPLWLDLRQSTRGLLVSGLSGSAPPVHVGISRDQPFDVVEKLPPLRITTRHAPEHVTTAAAAR